MQTPAITHCHHFSFGTRYDVAGGVHCLPFPLTIDVNIVCGVFWVQKGPLHSQYGLLMFSFVSLCQVVSQHSCQVNAVAPSTLFVLPKHCPPVLSEHADLETKHERIVFESVNGSFFLPKDFIDLHINQLKWVTEGPLAVYCSFFLEPLYKLWRSWRIFTK